MSDEAKRLGNALREYRKSAKVSMSDLLPALGGSEPTLARIERGEAPIPDGFEARYREAVRELAQRRHEAVNRDPINDERVHAGTGAQREPVAVG